MLLPGVGLGFLCEFEQGLAAGVSLASKSGLGGKSKGSKFLVFRGLEFMVYMLVSCYWTTCHVLDTS